MLSLRAFHLVFILLAIAGADLIGGWAIRDYTIRHDPLILALGIVTLAGSFGLIGYALWFVRKTERAHIQ